MERNALSSIRQRGTAAGKIGFQEKASLLLLPAGLGF